LTKGQVWQLARVADRLGLPVLCYGLRTDFRGELFTGSSELLAIANSLREIRTICHCGRKATMVVRQTEDGRALMTGDQVGIEKSMYVSLCRMHWEEQTQRWPVGEGGVREGRRAAAGSTEEGCGEEAQARGDAHAGAISRVMPARRVIARSLRTERPN